MIGIDTNVLVRYIVQDDLLQSARVTDCIEKNCTAKKPGFVNLIVLCELAKNISNLSIPIIRP